MTTDRDQQARDEGEAELDAARRARLEADRRLSMSGRLARLHELCRQMSSIAGAAKRGP